jgi:F0F1-type ATP synthase assembly protein I
VNKQPQQPHPFAAAVEWVAKITTVVLEMFLPAVGGGYIDRRWGTNYWTLVGLVLGMTVGLWHLLRMTKPKNSGTKKDSSSGSAGQ